MPARRIVQPAAEPVTLAEAKLHLRVDGTDEDTLITSLISAARETAEHRMQRTVITSTWLLTLDEFPDAIRLEMGRALSVSQLRYRDPAGAWQTLSGASYTLDNTSDLVQWVYPASGFSWPSTWDQPLAVEVTYAAGFGPLPADVPAAVKSWILLTVGALYAMREAGTDKAVSMLPRDFYHGLLDAYVVWGV